MMRVGWEVTVQCAGGFVPAAARTDDKNKNAMIFRRVGIRTEASILEAEQPYSLHDRDVADWDAGRAGQR